MIRGEWGGIYSVVDASRDADGPVVEHIPSARPPANPTASDSTRLCHPVIRVDLRVDVKADEDEDKKDGDDENEDQQPEAAACTQTQRARIQVSDDDY